ncbi:MAG: hypothetical protein LBD95_07920, partial [Clostridiales Family XIII bacterium]|nr:hypothetical protein [Clostridiales Family XIII bacterium]
SKTIAGIPQGVTYTVTEAEANADGYTTTSADASGTISGTQAEAVFTNTRTGAPPSPPGPGGGDTPSTTEPDGDDEETPTPPGPGDTTPPEAPTEPYVPGGVDPDVPPLPTVPGNNLIPDGSGYIELDENDVPLGRWEWDDDEDRWIFDEFPPLANLPQTGSDINAPAGHDKGPSPALPLLFGLLLLGMGLARSLGGAYKSKRERR